MAPTDDPAVLEALRRRRVREAGRVKAYRIKWVLWALLPIPLVCLHAPLWVYSIFVILFFTGPFLILPWLIFCAGRLMHSVLPEKSRTARFLTGVGLFLGLVLMNAAALYVLVFIANLTDWLYKRLT